MSKTHKALSPSASHRWLHCPSEPYYRLSLPATTSAYADEGTTAHWLAEDSCKKDKPLVSFLGKTCRDTGMEVSQEMVDNVQKYLDGCRIKEWDGCLREVYVEAKEFDLGGTVDFIGMNEKTLLIRDLKYGKGVIVSAEENPQLMIYGALAAPLYFQMYGRAPEIVRLEICQPRLDSESYYEIETEKLRDWVQKTFIPAANKVDTDTPTKHVPGEWCKFCPARNAHCPAQHELAVKTAGEDFANPPAPDTLPHEKIEQILEVVPILSSWLAGVETFALAQASQGVEFKGFKLVEKRANREWAIPTEAVEKLLGEKAYVKKLASVAQAEKIVGKAAVDPSFVKKVSSGLTLAPITDRRAAIEPAAAAKLVFSEKSEE